MEIDTIAAIATGLSNAGIGIVRVSGKDAVGIVDRIFRSKKENFYLRNAKTHTIHYGVIFEGNIDCFEKSDNAENRNYAENKNCIESSNYVKNNDYDNSYSLNLSEDCFDSVKESELEDICEGQCCCDNLKQGKKSETEKNIFQKSDMIKKAQKSNVILDEVLVSVMLAPNSYTKEDVVEINCHGGIVVTRKILETVIKMGARLAEPGEFTKRAFLNGRIDLSQAEAVIDIIHAKNDMALKNSVRQLRGDMYTQIVNLREQILLDVAFIEAALDDPEHISLEGFPEKLRNNVSQYLGKIGKLLKTAKNGRMIKEGIKTVILGKPNVGKSSLMNLLLGENRAIVTDVAGTTRDTLEENIMLNGISLNIVDTAGIRWTDDLVESIGVDKAKKEAEEADLILFVIDSSVALDENDIEILKSVRSKKMLILLNKSDLEPVVSEQDIMVLVNREDYVEREIVAGKEISIGKEIGVGREIDTGKETNEGKHNETGEVIDTRKEMNEGKANEAEKVIDTRNETDTGKRTVAGKETDIGKEIITKREIIRTSTKEQVGLEKLEEKITELFFFGKVSYDDEIYITNARHKAALEEAEKSLQQVMDSIQMNMPEDFYSIDLMNAYKELGRIIGEEVDEDLVNTIFKEFCMGK